MAVATTVRPALRRYQARVIITEMRKHDFAKILGIRNDTGSKSLAVARQWRILRDRGHFDRGQNDFLQTCPHLNLNSPDQAFWLASHPELLRCHDCSNDDLLAIGRRKHELTCNECYCTGPDVEAGVACLGVIWAVTQFCTACLEVRMNLTHSEHRA